MGFVDLTHAGSGANGGGSTPPAPPSTPPAPPSGGGSINAIGAGRPVMVADQGEELVRQICRNLNEECRDDPPALFRDLIVRQTMAILIGMRKPCVLLVGAAGTGKTKIFEEVARLIETRDPRVPPQLQECTIWELPLASVMAGSGIVGELEEKLQAIISFMSDPDHKAIVAIDEIHQLVGDNPSYNKIAQVLKPAMARGQLRIIAATTTQEASSLSNDPAFNRRFSRVIVPELTDEETAEILTDLIPSLINHYGPDLLVDPSIVPETVRTANRFHAAGNHRPDTAITLLDRACGEAMADRAKQVAETARVKDPATRQAMLQTLTATTTVRVSERALKRTAMRIMTGGTKTRSVAAGELEQALAKVRGQDTHIAEIVEQIRRHSQTLFPTKRPLSILIAGDSGTGKTVTAELIAEAMTGTEPIRLNMAEYNSDTAINRLRGSDAGYVGYSDHNEMPLDPLEANPVRVVVLDEFEKASTAVKRYFMGALEEGEASTARGKVVDFSHAIVIATTNAAHAGKVSRRLGFASADTASAKREELVDALSGWFDLELLNRFDAIVAYDAIDKETYADIVRDCWKADAAIAKAAQSLPDLPDEAPEETVADIVERTYVREFGARPASKAVREAIEKMVL